MGDAQAPEKHDPRVLALKAGLLLLWAVVAFGFSFFARDLQFIVAGWPFEYWMAAQGAVLIFLGIIVVYASVMKRLAPEDSEPQRGGFGDG